MPKQVMKRPAAKSAPGSPKAKKPRVDPIVKKCGSVSAAVQEASALPQTTREMLGSMLMASLNTMKEDRHDYQAQVVEMVSVTLNGMEKEMEQAVNDAQALVSNGDVEKAARDSKLAELQASLEAKNDEVKSSETALSGAKDACKTANQNHSAAEHAQAEGDQALNEMVAKKERLETALKENFIPLKEGAVSEKAAAKKMLASLNSVGKEHQVDASLMNAIGVTLGKEPSARGTFDNTSLEHFEEDLKRRAADLASTMEAGAAAKAERAATVQSALDAVEAANAHQSASSSSLQQSRDEQKGCQAAAKAAKKAVEAFGPEMEQAADARDAAQFQLDSFREGALANLLELKDRCPTPPAPPTPEEVPDVSPVENEPAVNSPAARSPFAGSARSPAGSMA